MKYLKLYEENIENVPEIGDYVICEESLDNITKEFISNNIGKIIGIDEFGQYYIVKYDYNVMPEMVMYLDEIIKFSKDRTELEEYLMAKKYNL